MKVSEVRQLPGFVDPFAGLSEEQLKRVLASSINATPITEVPAAIEGWHPIFSGHGASLFTQGEVLSLQVPHHAVVVEGCIPGQLHLEPRLLISPIVAKKSGQDPSLLASQLTAAANKDLDSHEVKNIISAAVAAATSGAVLYTGINAAGIPRFVAHEVQVTSEELMLAAALTHWYVDKDGLIVPPTPLTSDGKAVTAESLSAWAAEKYAPTLAASGSNRSWRRMVEHTAFSFGVIFRHTTGRAIPTGEGEEDEDTGTVGSDSWISIVSALASGAAIQAPNSIGLTGITISTRDLISSRPGLHPNEGRGRANPNDALVRERMIASGLVDADEAVEKDGE